MDVADIIVTMPDTGRTALIAEVKIAGRMDDAATQLSGYMRRVGASMGIVVVGNQLRILRDNYDSAGNNSIHDIGTYDTSAIPALSPPAPTNNATASFDFETQVQKWLESLSDQASREGLPEGLRAVIEQYVSPIIEVGSVRAAGPRVARNRFPAT